MKPQCPLRAETYILWTTVYDFRMKVRRRTPVNLQDYRDELDVIHASSDWPQIKMRCVDALISMNQQFGRSMLA